LVDGPEKLIFWSEIEGEEVEVEEEVVLGAVGVVSGAECVWVSGRLAVGSGVGVISSVVLVGEEAAEGVGEVAEVAGVSDELSGMVVKRAKGISGLGFNFLACFCSSVSGGNISLFFFYTFHIAIHDFYVHKYVSLIFYNQVSQ